MEIFHFGMVVEYFHNQFVNIIITYQSRVYHLLIRIITDQSERKMLFVGFYFGRKAIHVLVFFYFSKKNKNRSRLVECIVDGERIMHQEQPLIFSPLKRF